MFEYFKGNLAEKTPASAVVDVHGVGYILDIPFSTFQELPMPGQPCTLYAHLHVREDMQRLYGFSSLSEREIFRQLMTVNGVGPKVALSILSNVAVKDFVQAVNTQNASFLKSVPGIGLKTAQRLIMELKGKLDAFAASGEYDGALAGSLAGPPSIQKDATDAMLALGYTDVQVQRALMRVAEVVEEDAPVEEWIKKALQFV
jgi:Holliday junction DNA helicase RuvA